MKKIVSEKPQTPDGDAKIPKGDAKVSEGWNGKSSEDWDCNIKSESFQNEGWELKSSNQF